MIGAVCAFVCAVVLIAWLSGRKEPKYQGKKLSDWVYEHESFGKGKERKVADGELNEALRAIGTNGVPYYVKWMQYETPAWNLKLQMYAEKYHLPKAFRPASPTRKEVLSRGSLQGFFALGPTASNAAPALELIASRTKGPNSSAALAALRLVGPPALPSLGRLMWSTNWQLAFTACETAKGMSFQNIDVSSLVPDFLLWREQFGNSRLRVVKTSGGRMGGLGEVPSDFFTPDTLYAALTKATTHSNKVVKIGALRALGSLSGVRADAKSFVQTALRDPDEEISGAAGYFLSIDVPSGEVVELPRHATR